MIYIHIPFCRSFCIYCDFYSVAVPKCAGKRDEAQLKRFDAYAQAVVNETLARKYEILDTVHHCGSPDTLYIGGGTPSVLPFSVFSRLVDGVNNAVYGESYHSYSEFTLEVNPEDINERGGEYLDALKRLGVNRISMGVQSFDDDLLRWMNRRHNAAGAVSAYNQLRRNGFDNISVDLIFGISGLDMRTWSDTVDMAVSLAPEHISAYQLSIEEGSMLARLSASGKYMEADENQCREQYDLLCAKLKDAGFVHYEISNFAKPGFEAKHNSAYWRRCPYTGLGAGAHSGVVPDTDDSSGKNVSSDEEGYFMRVNDLLAGHCGSAEVNVRRWNPDDVDGYISEWGTDSLPADGTETAIKNDHFSGNEILTAEDIEVERIMLGLRTASGVPETILPPEIASRLLAEGALSYTAGDSADGTQSLEKWIRIPEDHFFVSDEIIRELIAGEE